MDDTGGAMEDRGAVLDGVEDAFPATPAQAGMLFHTLAAPGRELYVGQFRATLPASLDPARWRAAWDAVIARHGALRSVLLWEGFDEPVQVVRDALAPEWTEADWSDDAAFEDRLALHLERQRRDGLNLSDGPVNRFTLVRAPDRRFAFAWTCHHALADGWSAQIALREAAVIHDGGTPEPADAPPCRGLADWLAGRDTEADRAYWRDALAGYEEPARLRLPPGDGKAGAVETDLPDATMTGLRDAAARLGATVGDLIATAWGIVLHRASGRDDVVFGMATTLRPPDLPGVEAAVGNFVSTLPVRLRLDGGGALADAIAARTRDALAARPHEAAAPAEIERLSPLPPGEPLFEAILALESDPAEDMPALYDDVSDIHRSSYPLALLAYPGARPRLKIVHDGDRFGADAARVLLSMTEAALAALPDSLDASPFDLPVMAPGARAAAAAGASGGPAPDAPPVEESFARIAAEAPGRIAVMDAAGETTYGELDRLSSAWARRLAARGLGPGDRVGVLMDRSADAAAAILAILRAGCAYVPIDPRLPEARRALVLETSRPAAIFADPGLAAEVDGALVLNPEAADALPEADPRPASPEDPAYVIFTSGSTGAPKGVVVRRRNLAASNAARGPVYGAPPERFLLLSPLSFDSSVAGLFWTLAGGGALVLPAPGEEKDPAALGALIARRRATHTLCLPSVLDVLLERPAEETATLATVIAAGEPLPGATAGRFASILPDARLFNEYGPTEGAVWCLVHQAGPVEGETVPVGRPVRGARALLRDERGRPVPDGLPGELVLGGAGVAAGYLDDRELTERRFPTDPADPSRRLYRTGDLMRRRADGAFEFLGRIDGQVKVRGRRVEPGEVEAVLAAHPQVREAAVVPVGEGAGLRLAAVVRAEPENPPEIDELRRHAEKALPDWMRPAVWRLVSDMPRLPSGKVDRKALPAMLDLVSAPRGRAPRAGLESDLARIWREALWLDRDVGAEEDFFDLGGHSLLSMRVVNAVQRELGLRVPTRALARLTTVAALAEAIEDERAAPRPERPAPDRAAPRDPAEDPLFALSDDEIREMHAYTASWPGEPFAEGSLIRVLNRDGSLPPVFFWFNKADELESAARHLGPDQPVYGLRTGATVVDDPSNEMQLRNHRRVALHHLKEVLAAQPEGPYLFAGMCQGATVAVNIALVLHGLRKPVATIIMIEKTPPQAYPGHVDIVFGRDSFLNPYRTHPRAELAWNASYRSWTLETVESEYGLMFYDRHAPEICDVIRRRLAEARARPPYPLPAAAYAVDWAAADAPDAVRPGAQARVSVEARNAGPCAWGATENGGVRLAARWLDADGAPVASPGAYADLEDDWSAGATRALELRVRAPGTEGAYRLELDLVEEGRVRFSEAGAQPLTLPVRIAVDAPAPAETALEAETTAPEAPRGEAARRDPAGALDAGRRAHRLGDHLQAEAFLAEARADALALLADLGESRRRLGRAQEAEADLRLALRIDPKDARALRSLGFLLLETGRPLRAAIAFRRRLALGEDPVVRHALQGIDNRRNPVKRGVRGVRKLGRFGKRVALALIGRGGGRS